MSILSQDFVFTALQSDEEFPIDFDDVWESTGHRHIDQARAYIRREQDFLISLGLLQVQERRTNENKIKEHFMMSLEGLKYAIARANTKKGAEYLLFLIQLEKAYRENLERSFTASTAEPIPTNVQNTTDTFNRSMQELVDTTGTSKANLVRICKIYLIENVHFQKEIIGRKHLYFFNQQVFEEISISVRSKRGLDTSLLNERLTIDVKDFTSHTGKRTINKVLPSKYKQLDLF